LSEMVNEYRNNRCKVADGPRCNVEWVEKKPPSKVMEAPDIVAWRVVDPEEEKKNKAQRRVIQAPADLLKKKKRKF